MAEQYYNIHSLVRLRVCADAATLREIDLHLAGFRCDRLELPPTVVIEPYDVVPPTARKTVVDDYEYGDGGYHRGASRFRIDLRASVQTYHMDRLHLPINLIVQLALLRMDHTFLHGAGLSIDGRHVLFPAYPGTGKTSLVAAFVKAGAKLYGDDLCIVGGGQIYSYPQALSVYPHHLLILGCSARVAERAFRRTAFIDRISEPVRHGRSRPAKLARMLLSALRTPSINIPPDHVFGPEAIASEGVLQEVVALERSGEVDKLVREPVDLVALADQTAAILWHEWHASFHHLLLYDALADSGRSTFGRIQQVRDLALRAFQSVACSRVRIPARWDSATLVREFPAFWSDGFHAASP